MSTKKRAPKKPIDYQNGLIYKIVNDVNDLIYIGSTTSSLSRRWSGHKADAKKKECGQFCPAIRELGEDHFRILLIEKFPCTCKAELEAREYTVMSTFDKNKLYNTRLADGGMTEKGRAAIGALKSGHFGEDNDNFNRGCISHSNAHHRYVFRWRENGKYVGRSFTYGRKLTREEAYMQCCDLRNQIHPLSTRDLLAELPFAV